LYEPTALPILLAISFLDFCIWFGTLRAVALVANLAFVPLGDLPIYAKATADTAKSTEDELLFCSSGENEYTIYVT
jgi:hypothetical protein